jgi:hypothetical protein
MIRQVEKENEYFKKCAWEQQIIPLMLNNFICIVRIKISGALWEKNLSIFYYNLQKFEQC